MHRTFKFTLGLFPALSIVFLVYVLFHKSDGTGMQKSDMSEEVITVKAAEPDVSYKNESLETLAVRAINDINIIKIESLIADLHSENETIKRKALDNLETETGLDHFFTPPSEQNNKYEELKYWDEYVQKLKIVIEEKIPDILPDNTGKRFHIQSRAVHYLGIEAPHKAYLPLLRKLAANPEENERLRIKAVYAIARIPHDGMIDFFIELLDDDVLNYYAWENLRKLTHIQINQLVSPREIRKDNGDINFQVVKTVFCKWWETYEDEYIYDRGVIMVM